MKLIKLCQDCYVRSDRITLLEVVENSGEFGIDITVDGHTIVRLSPFNTRDEVLKYLEEIVAEISKGV